MARTVEISLAATSFIPATGTNGAQFVAHVHAALTRPALAFDNTTVEGIVSVPFILPASYAGGTLNVSIFFYCAADNATGDEVAAFTVTIEAVTPEDTTVLTSLSDFSGTSVIIQHDFDPDAAGTLGRLNEATAVLNTDAKRDSAEAGDQMRIRILRTPASESNMAGDLCVPFVVLYEGT